MGVGFALMEDFVPGETRGFKQYELPRAGDVPEIVSILVAGSGDAVDAPAKGVAECSNMAVAPAIANVDDARVAHLLERGECVPPRFEDASVGPHVREQAVLVTQSVLLDQPHVRVVKSSRRIRSRSSTSTPAFRAACP